MMKSDLMHGLMISVFCLIVVAALSWLALVFIYLVDPLSPAGLVLATKPDLGAFPSALDFLNPLVLSTMPLTIAMAFVAWIMVYLRLRGEPRRRDQQGGLPEWGALMAMVSGVILGSGGVFAALMYLRAV